MNACALGDAIFGFGELDDQPALLHASAEEDIRAAQKDPDEQGRAWTGLRKLRHLRRDHRDYGEPEELDMLEIEGRFAADDLERGFERIKTFVERYPLAQRPRLVELLMENGTRALADESSFLGLDLFSRTKLGTNMLGFLATQFPSDAYAVTHARRQLAEHHYFNEEYGDALLYYAQVADGPASAWTDFARFRIPLCLVRAIEFPDVDSKALWAAKETGRVRPGEETLAATARLFKEYLQGPPAPQRSLQAQRALLLVYELAAERERIRAHYYETIDSEFGRQRHAARAASFQKEADTLRTLLGPEAVGGASEPDKTKEGVGS